MGSTTDTPSYAGLMHWGVKEAGGGLAGGVKGYTGREGRKGYVGRDARDRGKSRGDDKLKLQG